MRANLTMACILILPDTVTSSADEPARAAQPTKMAVHALLREASEIALKQGEQEHFWTSRVLLHIGEVQIRAGDLDGALRSFRGSNYDFGRELCILSEAGPECVRVPGVLSFTPVSRRRGAPCDGFTWSSSWSS